MSENIATPSAAPQPERRHRRFSLRYPVLLRFGQGSTATEVQAVSKNVSIGGLLLESTAPIPQDCLVKFTLLVKGDTATRAIQLAGQGKVVRVENPGENGSFSIAVECSQPITELEYLEAS
jgi:hypothetical protein